LFKIENKAIGGSERCYIIAEVAQSHDGSLGMAHAFIDGAAAAGADAIKFQTHIAAQESTFDEPFRVAFSKQDARRFDYWQRMEFTAEQWQGLRDHAREQGLTFLSSAFSVGAVALLDRLDMPAWKIGSGEYRSTDLLAAMMATGKPVLFSTGMSNWREITAAVDEFRARAVTFSLFQCTSQYPTPLNRVGLNVISEMKQRYDCPVGLSDHSGTVYPAHAAIARGADMLEVHVAFHKAMFGPDVPASLTFDELADVVRMRDACAVMDGNAVDKDQAAVELTELREIFTKSLAPVARLSKGLVLQKDMLTGKKPGTGIPFEALDEVVGRRLLEDVEPERLLRWADLSEKIDA